MLYVDIPTQPEFRALAEARGAGSVSLYLRTTPLTQNAEQDRIELKNLAKQAVEQLREAGLDKRLIATIAEQVADLGEDDDFWAHQANSLAVFVTPHMLRTFRLPNRLEPFAEVSDRFHLKPLLRAVAFPNESLVLALAQGSARLVQVSADLPSVEVKVQDMPKDAPSAVKRASVRDRSPSRRIQGSEGQKVLLRLYARQVDAAMRALLAGRETPLILACAEPLASIFRSVSSYPHLLPETISGNPEAMSPGELADAARGILDAAYARRIAEVAELFEARAGDGRATTDLADAARAATFGAVDTLLVDIDEVVPGTVDEQTGAITFADSPGAGSYGVVDEIAGRALVTGARVLGVRKADIPGKGHLAAILRYAV